MRFLWKQKHVFFFFLAENQGLVELGHVFLSGGY